MQVSVNLQSNIFTPIILLSLAMLVILIITIYILNSRRKSKIKNGIQIKNVTVEERSNIKHKYIKKIDNLKRKIDNAKIDTRGAYQTLSVIIRHFVYEMTNIKVQNYSLEEIKKLNMQELCELVEEYYVPEFAEESRDRDIRKLNRQN